MRSWDELNHEIVTCRRCPRLVEWRQHLAEVKRRAYQDWTYWGRPVPGFGDREASLLVLGLAPAGHGANRTGRMFTGDSSADTLISALHRAGFASQPSSRQREDGLTLQGAFITAAARCAPPQNRVTSAELANCQPFLAAELALMPAVRVVLALGQVAFESYLRLLRQQGHQPPRLKFGHGVEHIFPPPLPALLACYHPSRQNTHTRRLTPAMLDQILARARELMG